MTWYSLATFIALSVNKMPPAAKCREISQNHVPHCSLYFLYFFFNHCWSTNCKHVICSHADNMGPINSYPVQCFKQRAERVICSCGVGVRNQIQKLLRDDRNLVYTSNDYGLLRNIHNARASINCNRKRNKWWWFQILPKSVEISEILSATAFLIRLMLANVCPFPV